MKKLLFLFALVLTTLTLTSAVAFAASHPQPFTVAGTAVAKTVLMIVALLLVSALTVKVSRAAQFVPRRSAALRALLALAFGATLGTASAASIDLGTGMGGALLNAVLPYLLTAAGALAVTGLGLGSKLLHEQAARIKNVRLAQALDLLNTLAFEKVAQISQEAVATLKTASADGKLSPEEGKAALDRAVQELWQALPFIAKKLFVSIAGDVLTAQKTFVIPKVEAAVLASSSKSAFRLSLNSTAPALTTPSQILKARGYLGL